MKQSHEIQELYRTPNPLHGCQGLWDIVLLLVSATKVLGKNKLLGQQFPNSSVPKRCDPPRPLWVAMLLVGNPREPIQGFSGSHQAADPSVSLHESQHAIQKWSHFQFSWFASKKWKWIQEASSGHSEAHRVGYAARNGHRGAH